MMYHVAIVGGGPAGLSAALVLARACRSVILFDDRRPRNAVASRMNGYLGRDRIRPVEFLEAGRNEVRQYGVELVSDRVIEAHTLSGRQAQSHPTAFLVLTQQGLRAEARKLLIATGISDVLPDIPGLADCYGKSVHHCPYCDGFEHRGKRLLAVGFNTKSAVGLAVSLRTWSENVCVLANGVPVNAEQRQRLAKNGIALHEERAVRVLHKDGLLSAVELENPRKPMQLKVVQGDAMFFNTDQFERSDLPRMLGCQYESHCQASTSERQQTTRPGVFVAGDADSDVQFVIVAAAEGAKAAVAINRELQDEDGARR